MQLCRIWRAKQKEDLFDDDGDNWRGNRTAKQIVRLKGVKNTPAAMRMIERL